MKGDYQISDAHWSNISPEGVDLTTKLLERDYEKRISLFEALVHPWIRDRDNLKNYYGANRKQDGESEQME